MKPLLILVSLFSLGLIGCATSESITRGGVMSGEQIKIPSRVLVMPMPDGEGRSDGKWAGSGIAMANGLKDVLRLNGFFSIVGDSMKLDEAEKQAASLKCDYILKSTITEWEDNATEWSGRPDSLAISSELYDTRKANFVSSASHREQSSGAAILSQSTNRFVPVVSNRIVQKIFGLDQMKEME